MMTMTSLAVMMTMTKVEFINSEGGYAVYVRCRDKKEHIFVGNIKYQPKNSRYEFKYNWWEWSQTGFTYQALEAIAIKLRELNEG
jgi:hypothetical protein